jgi:hypothetical protein
MKYSVYTQTTLKGTNSCYKTSSTADDDYKTEGDVRFAGRGVVVFLVTKIWFRDIS